MSCFPCLSPHRKDTKIDIDNGSRSNSRHYDSYYYAANGSKGKAPLPDPTATPTDVSFFRDGANPKKSEARSFTFRELANATKNFKEVNLIGEGGFGRVYKGRFDSGQIVAVKQLNHDGLQGHQEFIVEVLMLSLFNHVNLVTLIGYCTSGDQRLLVYEYMPMGSLEDHLFDLNPDKGALSWNTRIKIAVGAARGLEYLHCKANPPSRPLLKDQKKFSKLVDPNLYGQYPGRCLNYAIAIAAMCLNEESHFRPLIGDIVVALEYLSGQSSSYESKHVGGGSSTTASPSQEKRPRDPYPRNSSHFVYPRHAAEIH
ncbi:hypothetical protein ACFE04_012919 [Oxalis oulophora]